MKNDDIFPFRRQQKGVATYGWNNAPSYYGFEETLCAVFERFASAGLPPTTFTLTDGQTTVTATSSDYTTLLEWLKVRGKKSLLDDLTQQIHTAVLLLQGYYYSQWGAALDIAAMGVLQSGAVWPQDLEKIREVLRRLKYTKLEMGEEGYKIVFSDTQVPDAFPYLQVPTPVVVEKPVQETVVTDTSSELGEVKVVNYPSNQRIVTELVQRRKMCQNAMFKPCAQSDLQVVLPAESGTLPVPESDRYEDLQLGTKTVIFEIDRLYPNYRYFLVDTSIEGAGLPEVPHYVNGNLVYRDVFECTGTNGYYQGSTTTNTINSLPPGDPTGYYVTLVGGIWTWIDTPDVHDYWTVHSYIAGTYTLYHFICESYVEPPVPVNCSSIEDFTVGLDEIEGIPPGIDPPYIAPSSTGNWVYSATPQPSINNHWVVTSPLYTVEPEGPGILIGYTVSHQICYTSTPNREAGLSCAPAELVGTSDVGPGINVGDSPFTDEYGFPNVFVELIEGVWQRVEPPTFSPGVGHDYWHVSNYNTGLNQFEIIHRVCVAGEDNEPSPPIPPVIPPPDDVPDVEFDPELQAGDLAPYVALVKEIRINGRALPHFPEDIWEVSDIVKCGTNTITLVYYGEYSWTNLVLVPMLPVTPEVFLAGKILRVNHRCWEPYAFPDLQWEVGGQRKVLVDDNVSFDWSNVQADDHQCLSDSNLIASSYPEVTVSPPNPLLEQQALFQFSRPEGVSSWEAYFVLRFAQQAPDRVFRYKVAEGSFESAFVAALPVDSNLDWEVQVIFNTGKTVTALFQNFGNFLGTGNFTPLPGSVAAGQSCTDATRAGTLPGGCMPSFGGTDLEQHPPPVEFEDCDTCLRYREGPICDGGRFAAVVFFAVQTEGLPVNIYVSVGSHDQLVLPGPMSLGGPGHAAAMVFIPSLLADALGRKDGGTMRIDEMSLSNGPTFEMTEVDRFPAFTNVKYTYYSDENIVQGCNPIKLEPEDSRGRYRPLSPAAVTFGVMLGSISFEGGGSPAKIVSLSLSSEELISNFAQGSGYPLFEDEWWKCPQFFPPHGHAIVTTECIRKLPGPLWLRGVNYFDPILGTLNIQPASNPFYSAVRILYPYCETLIPGGGDGESGTFDADYILLRYTFTAEDGRDLDTRSSLTGPLAGDVLGWCKGIPSYGPTSFEGPNGTWYSWAGDNTGTGYEAVVFNVGLIRAAYPAADITGKISLFWYAVRYSGDFIIELTAYKGGVMERSGYTYVNVGGEAVGSLSKSGNVLQNISSCVDGTAITGWKYTPEGVFSWTTPMLAPRPMMKAAPPPLPACSAVLFRQDADRYKLVLDQRGGRPCAGISRWKENGEDREWTWDGRTRESDWFEAQQGYALSSLSWELLPAPTIGVMVGNFIKAMRSYADENFEHAPEEVIVKRLETCRTCPYWNESARYGFGKCNHPKCGCTKGKLWVPSEECPQGWWEKYEAPEQ